MDIISPLHQRRLTRWAVRMGNRLAGSRPSSSVGCSGPSVKSEVATWATVKVLRVISDGLHSASAVCALRSSGTPTRDCRWSPGAVSKDPVCMYLYYRKSYLFEVCIKEPTIHSMRHWRRHPHCTVMR